jgi:methionyl-tRNA formyltransferase
VLTPSPVKRAALAADLPVLQPENFRDESTISALRACAPDVLVVAAYGLLLPPSVLAVPRIGCLNIHASLLPRWRGAAPIQRAILAGDPETGAAIMRMEAGLDTGPVYATDHLAIRADDTTATLTAKLAELGARTLIRVLPAIADGSLPAVAQPVDGIVYAHKVQKAEAWIDWRQPADVIERAVRAYQPWPVAQTYWRGAPLRVHAAQVGDGSAEPGTVLSAGPEGLVVATGAGTLRLHRLQFAGRGVVTAREFIQSELRHGPLVSERMGVAP